MFTAIGVALLVIPKNTDPQVVLSNGYSDSDSHSTVSSRSSSSSQFEIRPIQSTGFPENPYSSLQSSDHIQSSEVSSVGLGSQTAVTNPAVPSTGSSSITPSSTPNTTSSSGDNSSASGSDTPSGSSVPSSQSHPQIHVSSVNNSTVPQASIPVNTSGGTSFVNGIAIVGTRAMSLYNPNPSAFETYAAAVNRYKEALPDVNVYCMLIPTACEFYGSAEVNAKCASQRDHINIVINRLKGIQSVDAYSALAAHLGEDIYLRTDHHWAALGGYYAAREFAKAAGVPFLPLSDYTERVNTGFVGTMYGYTNNSSIIKNNPEDFVYHVPKTVDWTTTYYNFKLSGSKVTGMYEPMKAAFFINYGNNKGDNYCTFMGGDAKIVHVQTSTKNGRRLAIFKESYGNTIPGYLFGSFEEIYVLDERYFPYNAIDYIREKGITDLLFANNTVAAGNPSIAAHIDENRTQMGWSF